MLNSLVEVIVDIVGLAMKNDKLLTGVVELKTVVFTILESRAEILTEVSKTEVLTAGKLDKEVGIEVDTGDYNLVKEVVATSVDDTLSCASDDWTFDVSVEVVTIILEVISGLDVAIFTGE